MRKLACEYDQMRFTILEELKSTLPKSLFYNYCSTNQIKPNQMLVFDERGKPEYPGKNLSEESREPTNSTHIRRRVRKSKPGHIGGRQVLSPLGQPCHLPFLTPGWFYTCGCRGCSCGGFPKRYLAWMVCYD